MKMLAIWAIMVVLASAFFGLIGGWCWPYAIDSWLIWAGKEACVCWWHGFLLGCAPGFGYLALPAAVITWIGNLFLL